MLAAQWQGANGNQRQNNSGNKMAGWRTSFGHGGMAHWERETYSKRALAAIVARRYSGRIRTIVTAWLGTEAEKLPLA